MKRRLLWSVATALVLAVQGGAASAQYYYPPGYGGYGWRGWGGGSTVYGDQARGLGVLAAGAGVYNQQTAVANSINANTAMQWNEYVFQSQQAANRRAYEKMARDQASVNKTADSTYKRLHDTPSDNDVMRGDALNVALDEVIAPGVYTKALKGAKAKFAGAKIREIPFQYAAAAISTSVDDLTQNGPPEVLKAPEFEADRAALRALRVKFREQADNGQDIDPTLIADAKAHINAMRKTLAMNASKFNKRGTNDYHDAENYLKGLYGLVTMLDSPAINVLLAGVEKRPDTTVGDLLGFMHAFNLRFGVAKTPAQRAVYAELYPILDALRVEVAAGGLPGRGSRPQPATPPSEFFSGMDYQHLDARRAPPAPLPNP